MRRILEREEGGGRTGERVEVDAVKVRRYPGLLSSEGEEIKGFLRERMSIGKLWRIKKLWRVK